MSNRLNWNKVAKDNLMWRNGTISLDSEKSIKISCSIKRETERALLIVSDSQECWLPRSVIEVDKEADGTAVIVLPEWLATERGLI